MKFYKINKIRNSYLLIARLFPIFMNGMSLEKSLTTIFITKWVKQVSWPLSASQDPT